jgi:hypothetical protein
MSALSFESTAFITEVEEISEEIATTQTCLETTWSFFQTTKSPECLMYVPKKKEESLTDEDIFF